MIKYSPEIDGETRKRIRISVAAYAYEFLNTPVMSDAEFDALAQSINLSIDTRRPDIDKWFRKNFNPSTGMWIHSHPELNRIAEITNMFIIHHKITKPTGTLDEFL
jgi:hypothetical protein